MATTYTHSKISVVDENSDVNIIYPENTGSDVSIDTSQNNNIPNGITNVQELANALTASAFNPGSGGGGTDYSEVLRCIYLNSEAMSMNLGLTPHYYNDNNPTDDYTWYPYAELYSGTRCILTINADGTTTSNYRFTLQGLHNVLASGKPTKYIKDGDYITFTANNGDVFDMEFNIDTYYNKYAGTTSRIATHHIDMISKKIIPNFKYKMRSSIANNGTAEQKNPYLASNEAGCVQAKLAEYYTNNIPNILKDHIIKKKLKVPYRYNGSTNNATNDTGSGLEELPELWIPFASEVNVASGSSYESASYVSYYTTLISSDKRIRKDASGSAAAWWLASASPSLNTKFRYIKTDGTVDDHYSNGAINVLLCFRFV